MPSLKSESFKTYSHFRVRIHRVSKQTMHIPINMIHNEKKECTIIMVTDKRYLDKYEKEMTALPIFRKFNALFVKTHV